MGTALQVILPGLFDLPLHELEPDFVNDELPSLNRILGLARVSDNRDYSIDAIIQSALALTPAAACLPVAQAFADADEDDPARRVLAEAVHLRADLRDAVVMPVPNTPENIRDIKIIINDLSELFKEDFYINAVLDGVFLMQLNDFDAPLHYPLLLSVLGKTITPFIEQSRQVLPWYRLLNEIQMFMHQHPINDERLRQGRLPINSLWFSGAGQRPILATRPRWFCDDALLNQFADSLGLPVDGCSAIASCDEIGDALIIDLRLLQWLKAGLDTKLDQILLDIERDLLAPALLELNRRRLSLRLRAGFRQDLELRPSAKLKFWRQPTSLVDWSQ